MSVIQLVCIFLIVLLGMFVNLLVWDSDFLDNIKHPEVLIGALLALDIGILIILFLGLFGVFW